MPDEGQGRPTTAVASHRTWLVPLSPTTGPAKNQGSASRLQPPRYRTSYSHVPAGSAEKTVATVETVPRGCALTHQHPRQNFIGLGAARLVAPESDCGCGWGPVGGEAMAKPGGAGSNGMARRCRSCGTARHYPSIPPCRRRPRPGSSHGPAQLGPHVARRAGLLSPPSGLRSGYAAQRCYARQGSVSSGRSAEQRVRPERRPDAAGTPEAQGSQRGVLRAVGMTASSPPPWPDCEPRSPPPCPALRD